MNAFRFVRDCFVILACMCVLLLTGEALILKARAEHAISQLRDRVGSFVDPTDPVAPATPATQPTGCPFDDPADCGG